MWQAILKEIGGRIGNAGAQIRSDSNMFSGKHFSTPSESIMGGGGNTNPIKTGADAGTDTAESGTDVAESGTMDIASDNGLKNAFEVKGLPSQEGGGYTPQGQSSIKGMLKDLDLNPKSGAMKKMSGGGGIGGGAMGGLQGGAETGADAGADASDMGDMADTAADVMG